jgi:adenylate cyclase
MSNSPGRPPNREIERKFKVTHDGWRLQAVGDPIPMRAGYLSRRKEAVVRVRLEGETAVLTLKGAAIDAEGRERPEYNIPIPKADAEEILAGAMLDGIVVSKLRHRVRVGSSWFEVDEFLHPRPGLVLAEIELETADQPFERPDWLGEEVTADPAYANAVIAAGG